MTRPVYKIETWTGAVKDHTIEKDATIYYKDILTTGVGTFSFTVPTVKGKPNPYYFGDIARNDEVRIWLGYDSISGNPNFIGKVTKISGIMSTPTGYIRQISGLSQGEILLRKHKTNTLWTTTDASVIVTALATALSLGTSQIDADTTDEDIEVKTETYFDLLKRISDYWYDATHKVQKDFYVAHNATKDLVWKARPIRTSGVETFNVGDKDVFYNVTYPIDSVKNNIKVYGAKYDTPSDHDSWTEATTNWSGIGGTTVTATTVGRTIGNYSIQGANTDTGPTTAQMRRTITAVKCAWKFHRYLNFDWWADDDVAGVAGSLLGVRVLAPDWANRFWDSPYVNAPFKDEWHTEKIELGPHNSNWSEVGSPDWENVQALDFSYMTLPAGTSATLRIDKLFLSDCHYYGTASSAPADRDLEVTDPRLLSDSVCTKRAQTLLLMKKDAPTQIELSVPGNTNVLIGDRLSMVIPAEGISANYYVFMVEQFLNNQGFRTKATMVDSINTRIPVKSNIQDILISDNQKLRQLAREEKII